MSQRTVNLLHVEDDIMQQRVIAHHLKILAEYAFAIVAVDSEDRAMEAFEKTKIDFVILDYQLAQGDGLHLLTRLRKLNAMVPIIAISGVATTEVAAELVHAGADDYFDKRNLNSAMLSQSIRTILKRTDTLAKRGETLPGMFLLIEQSLLELCSLYLDRMGTEPLEQLDRVERDIRKCRHGVEEIETLYRSICLQIDSNRHLGISSARIHLRPLFLDLLFRLKTDKDDETDAHVPLVPQIIEE
ncbi:hypothetical protein BH11PLA2_BH11PLA2_40980 [soil metagenome]